MKLPIVPVSGFRTSGGSTQIPELIAATTSQALQTARNRDQNLPSASHGDRHGRQVGIGAQAGRQPTVPQQLVKHLPAGTLL